MQNTLTKPLVIVSVILITICSTSTAQSDPVEALKKLYTYYPQEKIYLWYNKPAYVSGETIWFKAYVFSGYDLSFISTTLYVEMYDADKKLISTRLLPLISGTAQGSIDLDTKLATSVYYIRAYTRLMLNYNETFQYVHSIQVYNPSSNRILKIKDTIWTAKAFAEGGNVIAGNNTRVAVRLYSASPLPEKWSGYLYEENNPTEKLEQFNSLDKNIAEFSFTPESGKKYYVYIRDEYENYQVCPLPFVKNNGVSLSLEETGDSIACKLIFQNVPENGKGYSIVGNVQHQVVYHAVLKSTGRQLLLKIPTDSLDNGILHLTVFNSLRQPVAERLIFTNHSRLKYDSTVINQYNISASPRMNNEIVLNVDSISWNSYTVSVSDAEVQSSLQEENILSALWLTSDFSNQVQNPASYFHNLDTKKITALDALLISEKWSRFNWDDILNNRYPVVQYVPHHYLSYTGTVSRGNKLSPKKEVNLIFYYPDSSTRITSHETDSMGNISLDNQAFFGEVKVFYQLNSKKYAARLIDIKFERNNRFVPYSLPFPKNAFLQSFVSTGNNQQEWIKRSVSTKKMENWIDDRYKTLQGVVINSRLKKAKDQLNEKLSSGLFRSLDEIIFDFVNEEQNAIAYRNILSWLDGRVAGYDTRNNSFGDVIPNIRGSSVTLYLDEMQVDPGVISSISISDIVMVKVIRGASAFLLNRNSTPMGGNSWGGGGGVIAIYTSRGDLRPAQKTPSLPSNKIQGYDLEKKFFTPDYSDKSTPQPETDTRDQLLWQSMLPPTMGIDKTGISFFNNDRSKRYRITVQGFTEKGFPVFFEKIIEPALKSF